MNIETWTRIAIEGDDYFDVIESYDEICSRMAENTTYISATTVSGYRVTIRRLSIQAFYESGCEIMRSNWERIKDLEDLKKSVIGWEES